MITIEIAIAGIIIIITVSTGGGPPIIGRPIGSMSITVTLTTTGATIVAAMVVASRGIRWRTPILERHEALAHEVAQSR